VPEALWSPSVNDGSASAKTIADTIGGFRITPAELETHALAPFPISNFNGDQVKRTFDWPAPTPSTDATYRQDRAVADLMKSLSDPNVTARRHALLGALARTCPQLRADAATPVLAAWADQILRSPPALVPLGGQVPGSSLDKEDR
jgi:hypothetical protein